LIAHSETDGQVEREGADDQGDMTDATEPLVAEQEESAVVQSLRERLSAIMRAEQRLDDGTYGRSVRSGTQISDARLDADPAAELTVDEAGDDEFS
jgi:DnaK suppressor protein